MRFHPPLGLTREGSAPVSINQLRTTEANASFISTVSIWPIAMPDFASAYFVAGIGAESCSIGSSPAHAHMMNARSWLQSMNLERLLGDDQGR